MKKISLLVCLVLVFLNVDSQSLSTTQMQNARATGYAVIASRNPGTSFSVLMIPWDGINTLEYNAQKQINSGWHAQAAIKGNFFYQGFDGVDFTSYSSVLLSQEEFDAYKNVGTQWWIACSTLPPFSNSGLKINSNGAATITATDNSGNRTNPFNALTITADNPNYPYDNFGGSILFKNRSYTNGIVNSSRIRSVIYDNGNNLGGGLWFETTQTAGSNLTPSMVINNSGNVGIGTTSPQSILDVVTPTNGYASFASLMGVGNWSGIHFGYRENNSLYRKSAIVFERTDNSGGGGNAAGKVHILNGPSTGAGSATLSDAKLTIGELGNVGIGTTSPQSILDVVTPSYGYASFASQMGVGGWSGIHFGYRENNTLYRKSAIVFERTDNSGGGGNAAGKVHILNGPSSGAGSATLSDAKLTIGELGNVGIGSLNPYSKLDVKFQAPFNPATPGATPYGLFLSGQSTPDYATGITFSAADASPGSAQSGIYSQGSGSYGTKLYFATTDSYASGAKTRMMIDAAGNIGIGSLNPYSKLDVKFQAPFNPTTPGATPYGLFLSGQSTPDYATGITFSAGDASPGTAQSGIYSQGAGAYGTKLYFATTDSYASGAKTRMMIDAAGNVGIGTTAPGSYKLAVEGTIGARKMKITQQGIPWADYVFHDDYQLRSLDALDKYIKQYRHLPEVPTTQEVNENGLDVADTQVLLLKKIEELTLYIIEMNAKIDNQQKEIQNLKKRQQK